MTTNEIRGLGYGFGPHSEFHLSLADSNKHKGFSEPLNEDIIRLVNDYPNDNMTKYLKPEVIAQILPDLLVDMNISDLANIRYSISDKYNDRLAPFFQSRLMLAERRGVSDDVVDAYKLPALLEVMDLEDRVRASFDIAKNLTHLEPLKNRSYFKLRLGESVASSFKRDNTNHRSLKFIKQVGNVQAFFRGKVWELDHTHIHFEREGEEKEYVVKGVKSVGEVHSVFKSAGELLAVGFPLALIEDDNPDVSDLIENEAGVMDFKKVLMRPFDPDDVLFHTWASPFSADPAFREGIRFNVIPKAVEVSEKQYDQLKKIFGEMAPLEVDKVLFPIGRRPHLDRLAL